MVKEIDVCPVFEPKVLVLGEVPAFRYQQGLQEEVGRRLTAAQAVSLLDWMLLVRAFEQMVVALKDGKVKPYRGVQLHRRHAPVHRAGGGGGGDHGGAAAG